MRLEPAVFFKSHKEQRRIRYEEQKCSDSGDHGGGSGRAHRAEPRETVHGSVDHKIQEHRIEQRFREVRLQIPENDQHGDQE